LLLISLFSFYLAKENGLKALQKLPLKWILRWYLGSLTGN
jgi:hypothetical protein